MDAILIICGEASGDLQAAALSREFSSLSPGLKIWAVGGEKLKKAGAEVFFDIKSLAVMGFFDVLKKQTGNTKSANLVRSRWRWEWKS